MSKLLQSCEYADLHPRRGLRTAARRPDSFVDLLSDRIDDGWRRPAWSFGLCGVDLVITAANIVVVSGTPLRGTALSTITAGQPLYTDTTNGAFGPNVAPADANGSANLRSAVGISLHAALAGQPISYLGTAGDVLGFGAILTVNKLYVTSNNVGMIAPSADLTTGDYLELLGAAITTSNLRLIMYNSGAVTA